MYFLSTLQNLLLNSCCIFEIVATIWIQCSLYFGLDHAPSVAIGPSLNAGWIPWASLNYVQDSVWQQEMDCGITHSLSILLCLWLAPALEPKCENLFLLLRWMVLPPSSVSLVLVVPPTEVKGRRTGRSRYLFGTRSAATGWGTTSTSTCTSARHHVGMGGSTRHMRSPVTVRNQPALFPTSTESSLFSPCNVPSLTI